MSNRRRVRIMAAVALLVTSWLAAPALRAETPQERVERLRVQAKQGEARAKAFAAEADSLLAELDALDRQMVAYRKNQARMASSDKQLAAELAALDAERAIAETELESLREVLRRRLVQLYKARSTRRGPALYSAKDFQSGLRVVSALQQALRGDARLFDDYRNKLAWIEGQKQQALQLASARTSLAAAVREQQEKERQARIQKQNAIALARDRSERETRAARELRAAAERLEAQVRAGTAGVEGVAFVRGRVPWPVRGKVRASFGVQVDPEFDTRIDRKGIEIDALADTPVRAVAPGRVLYADWLQGYGQVVIVDHGSGSATVSGFLAQLDVKPKDKVQAGDVLGRVGETGSMRGPGLYFELHQSGKAVDPVKWLERSI